MLLWKIFSREVAFFFIYHNPSHIYHYQQGLLSRKRLRQRGFGAYCYHFSPFLYGEKKSRRNGGMTATKHRYSRNETQYDRVKMLLDRDFHFFQIEMYKNHMFSINMNINYRLNYIFGPLCLF
jgi:hypothetical protein